MIPWSRIFNDQEMLLAINTDADNPCTAWVIVDHGLHRDGDLLKCLYSTEAEQIGQDLVIQEVKPYTSAVLLTLPPAGLAIIE